MSKVGLVNDIQKNSGHQGELYGNFQYCFLKRGLYTEEVCILPKKRFYGETFYIFMTNWVNKRAIFGIFSIYKKSSTYIVGCRPTLP